MSSKDSLPDSKLIRKPNIELLSFLRRNVKATDAVLDIGSGDRRYHDIECAGIASVDGYDKAQPDFLIDLLNEDLTDHFNENSYDVVIMLDFIEHLPKERGVEIIKQAKTITRSRFIMLTPMIFEINDIQDKTHWHYRNPFNIHQSVWIESDFQGWVRTKLQTLSRYYCGIWHKK